MNLSRPDSVEPGIIHQCQDLLVRPAWPNEAKSVALYHSQNRSFHEPWEPTRSESYYTSEYWKESLEHSLTAWRRDASYTFFLFVDDEVPVGKINLSNVVRGCFQACHLGFGLSQDAQGRGLMSLGVRAVTEFAFGPLNLHRMMANYQVHNKRSERLLERVGFVKEGEAKQYLFLDGAWRDHVLTALLNPKWSGPGG